MSRSRSFAWLAFSLGLAFGWLAGAWSWTLWTPFSSVRLALARAAEVPSEAGWTFASAAGESGEVVALRPVLETVLASAVVSGVGRRIAVPAGLQRYVSVQLVDARGVTLEVLGPGEEWTFPASLGDGGRVWCLARVRVLPGEGPGVARGIVERIGLGEPRGE